MPSTRKVVQKRVSNVTTLHMFIPPIDYSTIVMMVNRESQMSLLIAAIEVKQKAHPQHEAQGGLKMFFRSRYHLYWKFTAHIYSCVNFPLIRHGYVIPYTLLQQGVSIHSMPCPKITEGYRQGLLASMLPNIKSVFPASRSGGLLARRPEGGLPHCI